jgi:predicted MPP superfamily phosphohydrolase
MRAARFAIFLAVVLAINLVFHGYLWLRLVRSPGWPAPWGRIGAAILVSLALVLSISMYFMRSAPHGVIVPLAWISFTWMGLVFLFFVLLLVTEPLRPLLRLLIANGTAGAGGQAGLNVGSNAGPNVGRMVARFAAIAVLVGGTVLGVVAVLSARLPVGVRTIAVRLAHWPAELSGYTVVQLTDIHVGGTVGKGFVENLVRRANALNPDMIVITGDLVDGSVNNLAPLVAPLASLHARDGVWFVTGNHEYYSGAPAWIEHVRTLGIRVLRNERVPIGGERGFDLAGTDDYAARGFGQGDRQGHEQAGGQADGQGQGQDIPRALAGRDPSRPVILLAHQPRSFPEAAALGVDLQLSGHTHGGQIFPMHYLTGLSTPYLAGLHRRGDSMIYVSRGAGYWGPPMRLGAPPEITRIVLSP